jgi:hypothetical protein
LSRAPIDRWVTKKYIEYPFEHREVSNYSLKGVYKDTGILPRLVAGEKGNRSGIST